MLGLALAETIQNFAAGPATSSGYSIGAVEIDAIAGHVVRGSHNGTNTNLIEVSTDNGTSYFIEHTDASASTNAIDALAVVHGTYAVAMSSSGNFYYYAAYPYTGTWTKVSSMTWGGNVVDYLLADIGDGHGPSLLVLTDAGSIWVTSAGTAPTTTGAWTQYDISSKVATPVSFALDEANGTLIVAASATAYYCNVADGVAVGDFTVVSPAVGATIGPNVAHNGERYALFELHTSGNDCNFSEAAASGWDFVDTQYTVLDGLTPTNVVLMADPATGMFFYFVGETASAAARAAVSRDGIQWRPATALSAQNLYIDGKRGTAPKLHPITRRFIGVIYIAVAGTREVVMQTL